MPLRGGSLAASAADGTTHYMSTGSANKVAATEKLSKVPLFKELVKDAGPGFLKLVSAALLPANCDPGPNT